MTKRKQTYEQAMAGAKNLADYRRRRTAEALARQEAAKHEAEAPQHSHYWTDWSMDPTQPLEHRSCRCGATETREFRGL